MTADPFLRRVTIRNYKSIAACKVDLGPLMFLVGPNGSGKSNFLDAIRFVAEALRLSVDFALRDRGSIREVRRRSGGHPTHFSIRLDFHLPDGQSGHYAFRIGAREGGGFIVQEEECQVRHLMGEDAYFHVKDGNIEAASSSALPATSPDRLLLIAASGHPTFRPVFDALASIEVYNFNPAAIGGLQSPDAGEILKRDGANAASVFRRLSEAARKAIIADIERIAPGITGISYRTLGPRETLAFLQAVPGQPHSWAFPAESMSDGTLRAFAVLLSLHQGDTANPYVPHPRTIGLEEPETALHPAAARILRSALREGARRCQVLVTSHSPDLLDDQDIPEDSLLAVTSADGLSQIGPIDAAAKQILRERLFTAGELLRQDQLTPDPASPANARNDRQLGLFERDMAG